MERVLDLECDMAQCANTLQVESDRYTGTFDMHEASTVCVIN